MVFKWDVNIFHHSVKHAKRGIRDSFMKVVRKILPGADGSKRFVKLYADKLVCVRYRIDSKNNKRYTTIELIVDEVTKPLPLSDELRRIIPHPLQIVSVRIELHETEIQTLVKSNGGKWDRNEKLWKIPYRIAQKIFITDRIIW